ncbi:hypothetical protein D9V29_13990 [Mycetocola manganoxydans]|uniref:Uncharacterized protein n=1 Tax=Mycetocola manganoxydans TaxID=699879 RepID=A0A3L6ZKH0_9MICO|nr:hypothetical protein D9V29_13990 [Mycetocola manganoxydans]GHD43784.1 hypothetical protein GCM10008097_10890 [Mycetocola manganoxydans]
MKAVPFFREPGDLGDACQGKNPASMRGIRGCDPPSNSISRNQKDLTVGVSHRGLGKIKWIGDFRQEPTDIVRVLQHSRRIELENSNNERGILDHVRLLFYPLDHRVPGVRIWFIPRTIRSVHDRIPQQGKFLEAALLFAHKFI